MGVSSDRRNYTDLVFRRRVTLTRLHDSSVTTEQNCEDAVRTHERRTTQEGGGASGGKGSDPFLSVKLYDVKERPEELSLLFFYFFLV